MDTGTVIMTYNTSFDKFKINGPCAALWNYALGHRPFRSVIVHGRCLCEIVPCATVQCVLYARLWYMDDIFVKLCPRPPSNMWYMCGYHTWTISLWNCALSHHPLRAVIVHGRCLCETVPWATVQCVLYVRLSYMEDIFVKLCPGLPSYRRYTCGYRTWTIYCEIVPWATVLYVRISYMHDIFVKLGIDFFKTIRLAGDHKSYLLTGKSGSKAWFRLSWIPHSELTFEGATLTKLPMLHFS